MLTWRGRSMVLSVALALASGLAAACNGGGSSGDDDDTPPAADAAPTGECIFNCASPNMCCDVGGSTFCIAVTSDVQNCGGCGEACDPLRADSCGGSQCKCGFSPACAEGTDCCGTQGCKNTQTDPQNCGGCGLACGPGATCEAGQCKCGGITCNAGESCCDGACVDTKVDELNCGTCGMMCNVGMATECNNSVCTCPGGGACPATGIPMCCGTGCVDICADVANCGGCGQTCAACLFGACFPGGDPLEACLPF